MHNSRPIALVTGASSGIGEAVAIRLAKAGYKVYGTSRRSAHADRHAFEMLSLDVTNDESVDTAVCHLMRTEVRIDLLVNKPVSASHRRAQKKVRSTRQEPSSRPTSSGWFA
jgi:NADP-dependent 3-hydroxy acid dehydrogenase YdfG